MHRRLAQPSQAGARGFSLVEMLLAVFILGIGVISIAALFPAGIALQRQATDDTLGPIVAKNAFATIRSKLRQDDFGSFQDFGMAPTYIAGEGPAGTIRPVGGVPIPQVSGDWGWMRPGFFTGASNAALLGTIDIFSANYTRQQPPFSLAPRVTGPWAVEMPNGHPGGPLFGIPYNRAKYPLYDIAASNPTAVPGNLDIQALSEPNVTFSQSERSYPQGGSVAGSVPVYYWDCMFRRNGGRVQVAVFIYRVTAPGGETRAYSTVGLTPALISGAPTAPAGSFEVTQQTPPIPALYIAPNFGLATSWPNRTVATPIPDEIPGTAAGTTFAPERIWDDWQLPNSWWVDNLGTVHRVLNGRTNSTTGPVKLQRPIPVLPRSPVNGFAPNGTYPASGGPNAFISGVWFVPQRDSRGNILTPIFAAVEEL